MSTVSKLKCAYNNNSDDEKDDDDDNNDDDNDKEKVIGYLDLIDVDILNEMETIQKKERTFVKLWRLYSLMDKFFIIINFSTLLFSIFISESSLSLALSIYTLSFSIIFDTKKYVTTLEKLIILYQDEIIPEINKCVRKYHKNDLENNDNYSDIIYELQQIEKDQLNKCLGSYFSVPKSLRTIDWKRISLIILFYFISFISLSVACYFKSIGKLELT